MCSSMVPVATQSLATQSLHQTYTLFRVPEEEMVEMGCQDEMVEMEPQGDRERGETLVCRDHVVDKVNVLNIGEEHGFVCNLELIACHLVNSL